MHVVVGISSYRIRVCTTGWRLTDHPKLSSEIMDREVIPIGSTASTASTFDLTVQLSRATAVIKRDAVQKLIALWRAADVPVLMVEADVKDGRAVIRIVVERVMTKIVRDLPCDIEGFPIVVEEQSRAPPH